MSLKTAWSGNSEDSWGASGDDSSQDSFWASYSDLMAGLLMIFVLSSILFTQRALEITNRIGEWAGVARQLCGDEGLQGLEGVTVHCDTGAIEFDTNNWFRFGSSELQQRGQTVLLQVMPIWLEKVTTDAIWQAVEAIEFDGHADRLSDTKLENMQVSADRAQAVMTFLVDRDVFSGSLLERGIVAGYGARNVPASCDDREQCEEARRVVVKVNLGETDVLRDLYRLLTGTSL